MRPTTFLVAVSANASWTPLLATIGLQNRSANAFRMDALPARIVRDTLIAPAIANPQHAAHDALAHVLRGRIQPGARVAITAGSRGIAGIAPILRGLVNAVRDVGGDPFLVAAMGSHGGGTGPGQRGMLESLGVTEESVGAPNRE